MARRSSLIAWALLGIAALTVLLSVEVARSERTRRYTAERVLTDYAALGAEAVATRLQNFLSPRLYGLLGAVSAGPPGTRDSLAKNPMGATNPLAPAVSWAGRVRGSGAGSIVRYDSAPVPADLSGLVSSATKRLPDYAYFGMLPVDSLLVVFAPRRPGRDTTALYALPAAAVAALVEGFIAKDPVLPPALTHERWLGSGVSVAVSLPGRVFAGRGGLRERFHGGHSMGPMFADFQVTVGLADSLAPLLVVGGLPASRIPFVIIALLLSLAFAVAGLLQLRERERLTRLREDFVAGASHELRTPLAQIRLFAETLRLERVRSEAERNRALVVIEREARRLAHLVENLLHFSRAERGTLRVAPEETDAGALTREIVAEFGLLADKAGVVVQADAIEPVLLCVDPGAWRQIVLNLLDNAVKYGAGSAVAVALSATPHGARLSVTDRGSGVSPGDRERIWERFWRGAHAGNGVTGTGIGLATVRDLVRLHGGSCRVENAEPQGARFVVEIPGPA